MNAEWLAEALLNIAPYSFGLKTFVFFVLAVIMIGQKSLTSVGKWLVAFFIVTTLMSVALTILMVYLAGIAEGTDINTAQEWFLVVTDALGSLVVAGMGIGVMVAQRTVEREAE